MKNSIITLLAALMILSLSSCSGSDNGEPAVNLPELKASFSSDSFNCQPGEKLSLPFTVTNIENAVLAFSAKSSSSDSKVTVTTDETYSGTVEFSAPTYSTGESITVTLTVSDPANKRTAEAKTEIKMAESDPLVISLASDIRSMATKPSGTFSVPITLDGVLSTVSVSELTVSSGWSAKCNLESDSKSGHIDITAPAALTSSVNFNLTVKDANNRTASLAKTISIIEITNSEKAANCHIAAPGSTITIEGVKGNSTEKLTFNNASLVWQDAQGLVKSVSGNGTEGVVVVSLNPGVTGNAVVAAKENDTVVWSWLVWVINYDPTAEPLVWTGEKTGKVYTFMDGDLGSASNTKYEASSFGLLYQWGRKDPFVGGSAVLSNALKKMYDIDGNEIFDKVVERPTYSDHTSDNLQLAIENPMILYSAPSSAWPVVDWLTNNAAQQNDDLWGGVSGYKSVYDPCPYGWRVPPAGEAWGFRSKYKKDGGLNDSKAYDSSYPWFIEYDDEFCIGFRYKAAGSTKEYWFPFSGKRECNNGALTSVGGGSQYHTCTTSGNLATEESLAWGNPASESPLNRPYASSIRCVRDE